MPGSAVKSHLYLKVTVNLKTDLTRGRSQIFVSLCPIISVIWVSLALLQLKLRFELVRGGGASLLRLPVDQPWKSFDLFLVFFDKSTNAAITQRLLCVDWRVWTKQTNKTVQFFTINCTSSQEFRNTTRCDFTTNSTEKLETKHNRETAQKKKKLLLSHSEPARQTVSCWRL